MEDVPPAVLGFWFGPEDVPRKAWFQRRDAFDAEIRQRFGDAIERALHGELDAAWHASRDGLLAGIVVLDQFTRNAFRGTPRAFAGDAAARALARRVLQDGLDAQAPRWSPLRRQFVLMPLEHAEDVALQEESVRRFRALAGEAAGGPHAATLSVALDYAERHRDIVRRFGRFPHRNGILGRVSRPEETDFLLQRRSRF
jgi:uncharacterized protein (DUF924 family)